MQKIYVVSETSQVVGADGVPGYGHRTTQTLYFSNRESAVAKAQLLASEDGYIEYQDSAPTTIRAWRDEWTGHDGKVYRYYIRVKCFLVYN